METPGTGLPPQDMSDNHVATDAFRDFASRLRAGDEAAAEELLARYSARLLNLARKRIGKRFAAEVDPEDVVRSALTTFFHRVREGSVELRDWSSLSALLSLLVLRKCAGRVGAYSTLKEDVHCEVPLSDLEGRGPAVLDREPTPGEVAAFVDIVEHLLSGLPKWDRPVIEGLIAGESIRDLAARLGRSERYVRRALARIQQTLLEDSIGKDFGHPPRQKTRGNRNTGGSSG